jgi:acyl-CoA synthetase (AMP-forming)/AMP-acid ligase II
MTPEGTPGEIWISGPNIARGYWGNRRANRETFVTRNGRRWLRTGDLGFLHGGEIHICGRIKSILIVRGMKHSFEDIERTVAATHAAFTGYPTAAFSPRSAMGDGEGLVVWQETSAKLRGTNDEELARALIRSALIREHGINPAEIELLAPGAVPRTRSGKIMRQRCCEIFEQTRARSYTACIDNHT